MKRTLFLLLVLFGTCGIFAQSQSKYIKAADEAFANKNYYSALGHYRTALDFDTSMVDLRFKLAESARLYDAYHTAEKNYQYILNSAESKNYPLAKYGLASVKRSLGKYAEAVELFQQYLATNPTDAALKQRTEMEIKSCLWASKVTDNPNKGSKIEHLGTYVNTPRSDFAPLALGDTLWYSSMVEDESKPQNSNTLIFTSINQKQGEIAESVSAEDFTAHTAFSQDKNKMYYTLCNYDDNNNILCEIYFRTRNGRDWDNPTRLLDLINVKGYTATQPSLCYDSDLGKEILYFVSDRPGGKGNLDVWYSIIDNTGAFSVPQNLSQVNTPQNEYSPFFHSPTKTLYFSSNGYENGFGGLDIYKTKKISNNNWAVIEHGGVPLNSSYNDLYYTLNDAGTTAYFASNRLNSAYIDEELKVCCNDIYREDIIIINLLALTFDKTNNQALKGCKVELIEISNRDIETKINPDGNDFTFRLDVDKKYKVIATRDNYMPDTLEFTTEQLLELADITKKLYLQPNKVELEVFTFNANDRLPLDGCRVRLIDAETNVELFRKENPEANDFKFNLDPCKKYLIIAERDGYKPDTVRITADCNGKKMRQDMYLAPNRPLGRLADYLPLPLYFDNDEPDRRTTSRTTTKSYGDTYFPYYAKKEEFKTEYAKGLTEDQKQAAYGEVNEFFERGVKRDYEAFLKFSEWMLTYLEQGQTVEIVFQGFASPRAASAYNDALGDRRAKSIRNHFDTYQNGVFKKYFDNNQLRITEVSYGSRTAPSTVVGNLYDERNSIYSVPASKERRVEIIEAKPLK